jgi:hypothetical protein
LFFLFFFLKKKFSIINIKKEPDKKTLPPTRDNKDFAVDNPSPINSKIKINHSSLPDDLNNIQHKHSEIELNNLFLLDLGNLATGPTRIKLNVSTRGE